MDVTFLENRAFYSADVGLGSSLPTLPLVALVTPPATSEPKKLITYVRQRVRPT